MAENKNITPKDIEKNIRKGLLSPAARVLHPDYVLKQYAEANALTVDEAYDELKGVKNNGK